MRYGLLLLIIFSLTSCVSMKRDMILDDDGNPHYTLTMSEDTAGQNYFPAKRVAAGKKVFIFDPNEDAWAAYDAQGNRVATGSASGGMDTCPGNPSKSCRTVTGTYHVLNKEGPDCKSSEFPQSTHGGARMPYCMHFHDGFAIHAAYDVPGYNASHGCIRVLPGAAKWLNKHFMNVGTTVIVRNYDTPDNKPRGS